MAQATEELDVDALMRKNGLLGSEDVDALMASEGLSGGPTYAPEFRSNMTPVLPDSPQQIRIGQPKAYPENSFTVPPPPAPAVDVTTHPQFNQGPTPLPMEPPNQNNGSMAPGFLPDLNRALFPSSGMEEGQPLMVPTGEGGMRPDQVRTPAYGPLDVVGDLAGVGVRAAGTTLDPILPWDARGKTPEGGRQNWLEGMQDPETGVARPAREGIAESIKTAWEYATDEDKPALMRAAAALMGGAAAAAFLGAATVEDPLAVIPGIAQTKAARAASDLTGRGLQKGGSAQMTKVLKPGIPAERKGFDVQTVFDENIGGSPRKVFEESRKKIQELSAELKARVKEGADEGHRVDINRAIDEALADIRDNHGASADNIAVLDNFDRTVALMKARARKISRQTGAPDGSLDLAEAQSFKQDLGNRGAWRHIAEKRGIPLTGKESTESRLAELVYHHLNETIDDLAPSGVRDVNRRLSKLIPVNQAAGHRAIIEGRNNVFSMSDMLSAVATAANPKLWPMFGIMRASKSGTIANSIYKLGTKLRNATTSAEKARYIAAMKKLGLSDAEIAANVHLVDESGGEQALKDVRVREPEVAKPEAPPNAVPFRRQGEPALPPERRVLPQEEDDILYQEGENLPAKTDEPDGPGKVAPMFYSSLRRAAPEIIKKAGGKMAPKDFLASLLKGGKVKGEEIRWTGLLEYLKARAAGMKPGGYDELVKSLDNSLSEGKVLAPNPDKSPITAQEIEDFLNENEVELVEHRKGMVPQDERLNVRDEVKKLDEEIETIRAKEFNSDGLPSSSSVAKRLESLRGKRDVASRRIDERPTKYAGYNIENDYSTGDSPKDYGELLLSWKRKPSTQRMLGIKPGTTYQHGHWNENDITAHVRYSTKTTPDGKKVLFLEEIQGDWGQQGRKRGFVSQRSRDESDLASSKEALDALPKDASSDAKRVELGKQIERLGKRTRTSQYDVPDGPFVGDTGKWTLLGLKRMLRYAAENGFDYLSWTTGEQQAKRWSGDVRLMPMYNEMVPSTLDKYLKKNWGANIEGISVELQKRPIPKKRYGQSETPDGMFRIEERTTPAEIAGREPQYYLRDDSGNDLDGPFDSEEDAMYSDSWPTMPNTEEYSIERRDPEEFQFDVEQHHDGRWYIVDNHKPREDLVPREQENLFGDPDTRDEGSRVDEAVWEEGFDNEEDAQDALRDLREEKEVDATEYYVVEDHSGRDEAGPFSSESEAEDAMPTTRDEDAASVQADYGDDITEYSVVDEDGDFVRGLNDYYDDEDDARRAMMDHWEKNKPKETPAIEGQKPNTQLIHQQGIRITDAMKKSVLEEGQELFQKQKGAVKGQIQKKRLGSVITLFRGRADVTTWMHEYGHWLRSDMLTPEQNKAVLAWTGASSWNRHAEEKFARGLERYFYNGVAPHKSLEQPYATIRDAFRSAYKDARGTEIGQDIPEAMRIIYDAIFLRGQKIRDVAKVQRLLKAARRAGMSSPRIIPLLKRELEEKERAAK